MKVESADKLLARLSERLDTHRTSIQSDPQSNPVKLLAYDLSKDVEAGTVRFRTLETLIKQLSDEGAVARALRLGERAGVNRERGLCALFQAKASEGFDAFQRFSERADLGMVLTAHPTFSLSRELRDVLGDIATHGDGAKAREHLSALPYLPERAPTLGEEHADAQAALERIQDALDLIHAELIDVAREAFPDRWTEITPRLVNVYSWVGYDIDGRTDIGWGDALRLRLEEKRAQLSRYVSLVEAMEGGDALASLLELLQRAETSAAKDLALFQEDFSDPENLVAAANNLTRDTSNRLLNMSRAYDLIEAALPEVGPRVQARLVLLRSRFRAFALGTARIHFRINQRHVISAVRGPFEMSGDSDSRTLLERAGRVTERAEPVAFNFASLALERSTAHRQLILSAMISRYIDDQTPIRFLIAEVEDPIVPLGLLYLAKTYGVDHRLDISPLFETRDALSGGGRIVEKMLSVPAFREAIRARGVLAVQTGFSDAGRFMGQLPACLAVERLQSHLARAMDKAKRDYGLEDIQTIVFNTHGESLGRGGHPGTIEARADYAMSPWARLQYAQRGIPLVTEASFQGGDGYLWFQTPELARATLEGAICARHADVREAEDDPFYAGRDFSWDVYRTLRAMQESLYVDPNYVTLLGAFGQNLLIPTGSRAAKRASAQTEFNPRQLRAIPHNAVLQQFACPANIFYGVGRASDVEPERFQALMSDSARMRSLFEVVEVTLGRTALTCLTAYGRLFDPGFWIGRARSGVEPQIETASAVISETLMASAWRSRIMDLANRLRLDLIATNRVFPVQRPEPAMEILHAVRLAVLMKMMVAAVALPDTSEESTSRSNVLAELQSLQIDPILLALSNRYANFDEDLSWTQELSVAGEPPARGDVTHIFEEVVKPLSRARDLVRQVAVALSHRYDAFG